MKKKKGRRGKRLAALALTAMLGAGVSAPMPAQGNDLGAMIGDVLATAQAQMQEALGRAAANKAAIAIAGKPGEMMGACEATDLFGEETAIAFWKSNISAITDVASIMLEGADNEAKMSPLILARTRALEEQIYAVFKDLSATEANIGAKRQTAILAQDHDPNDDAPECADFARSIAIVNGGAADAAWRAAMRKSQESGHDGHAADYAQAYNLRLAQTLHNPAFKDQAVLRAGSYIINPDGVLSLEDQKVFRTLGIVLSNPIASPKAEGDTVGGRRAQSAIKRKSAFVAASQEALRYVTSLQAPSPAYTGAIQLMEQEAGISGDLKQKGAQGIKGYGHSYIQFTRAAVNYFLSPNKTTWGDATNSMGNLRLALQAMKMEYDMAFRSFELELRQTFAMASVLGGRTTAMNLGAGADRTTSRLGDSGEGGGS